MTTIAQKVCVDCQVPYQVIRNGVTLVTLDDGQPSEAYEADLFLCPGCGHRLITGVARTPLDAVPEADEDTYCTWLSLSAKTRCSEEYQAFAEKYKQWIADGQPME